MRSFFASPGWIRGVVTPLITAFRFALLVGLAQVPGLVAAPLSVTSDTNLPEDTIGGYDSISVSSGATLTIGGGCEINVTGAVMVTGN